MDSSEIVMKLDEINNNLLTKFDEIMVMNTEMLNEISQMKECLSLIFVVLFAISLIIIAWRFLKK